MAAIPLLHFRDIAPCLVNNMPLFHFYVLRQLWGVGFLPFKYLYGKYLNRFNIKQAAVARGGPRHSVIIKIFVGGKQRCAFVSYQLSSLRLSVWLHTTQLVFGLVCGVETPPENNIISPDAPRCSVSHRVVSPRLLRVYRLPSSYLCISQGLGTAIALSTVISEELIKKKQNNKDE